MKAVPQNVTSRDWKGWGRAGERPILFFLHCSVICSINKKHHCEEETPVEYQNDLISPNRSPKYSRLDGDFREELMLELRNRENIGLLGSNCHLVAVSKHVPLKALG